MRSENVIRGVVVVILLAHAALLALLPPGPARSVASNLAQLSITTVAVAAAMVAARKHQGRLRRLWELTALSFAFWAIGQALFTYYRAANLEVFPSATIVDLPYLLFYLPLFATLFMGNGRPQRAIDWPRTLDLTQLGIILSTLGLYFALFLGGGAESRSAAWELGIGAAYNAANIVLWSFLVLRTVCAEDAQSRRAFLQLLGFFTLYVVGETIYSELVTDQIAAEGAWYDLLYYVPFAFAAVAAIQPPSARKARVPECRERKSHAGMVEYALTSLPPLAVLFLGVHISRTATQLGLTVISASFLCHTARLWITQHEVQSALRRLHSSSRRFRAMVEKSNEAVALLDAGGNILFLTKSAGSVFGMSADGRAGASAFALVHEEDLARVHQDFAQLAATPGGVSHGEYRAQHADGSWRWLECTATNLLEDPDVGAIVVNYRDVTERREAELALQRSEARYRDLFENANDVLFTLDLDANLTSINRKGTEISGYQCEDGVKVNIAQVVAPEDLSVAGQMIGRALAGDAPPPFELQIVKKTGERVLLEVSGRGVLENGLARGVQAIARDITERRALENQLRQSQKMEAVGLLAGGLAHDFNNLLAVILGYTDILGDDIKPGDKREKPLRHIHRAAERAATLTRQLLAFSRKQVMQPRVLDLNVVAMEMSKLLSRLIGEHILQTTRLNPRLGRVMADPSQIEQVLMNLAVNARDAMPNGGRLVIETDNVQLDEETARQCGIPAGKYALLAVQDTGTGMTPEVRARIFEPFFTTKEAGKGTGLGLAMVYGIVKQSGAHITVESEPGRGTTFRVYLPLAPAESVAAAERAETSARPSLARGSETILLVEDEPSLRGLVAEYLSECGYHMLVAAEGHSALRLAQSHAGPIHMLVTDVVMPGISGPELAQRLTQTHPAVKKVYLSGYTDSHLLREELLGTDVTFIHKPIRPVELAARLRSVLDDSASIPGCIAAPAGLGTARN